MNGELTKMMAKSEEYDASIMRFEQFQKLPEFNTKITSLSAGVAAERLVRACLDLTGAASGSVYLREMKRLARIVSVGKYSAVLDRTILLSEDYLTCIRAVKSGKPHIANHAQDDEYIKQWKSKVGDEAEGQIIERIGSYVFYPLEFEGKIVGILGLQSEREDFFTNEVCALVDDIRPMATMVVENARLHESLKEQEQELERINRDLHHAREELRDTMEETFEDTGDRFAGQVFYRRIAHDVKNVLAAISTHLENLLEYHAIKKMPNTRKRSLSDLIKRVKRSGVTIETFLEVAKEPAPKLSFFDINRIIKQTIRLLQGKIDFHSIEVDASGLAKDLPEVYVSRVQMTMVLFNVISNTVDALSKVDRPRKLQLRTRVSKGERWIELIIEDNGCGMSRDEQKNLFEPYFSTKGEGGVGLGLFGSKRIIEKHRGSIGFQSRFGKGTTFTILLPMSKH